MFVIDDLMLAAFAEAAPEMFATEAFGAEALGTALGAEALMGLGAEALGAGAVGGAEAALGAEAMAADAAAGGAGAGAANINAAQVAAQQNAAMQVANPGITGIPDPNAVASVAAPPAPTTPFTPPSALAPAPAPPAAPPPVSPINTMGLEMPGAYAPPSNYPMGMDGQFTANQFIEPGSAGMPSMENTIAQANVPVTPPSALDNGMAKAMKFAKEYPLPAMAGAYMGASALGLLNPSGNTFNDKPYDGPLSRYKLSPNFQAGNANPANFQYTPRYAMGGGIMNANPMMDNSIRVGGGGEIPSYAEGDLVENYAKGGSLSDSIESYQKMLGGQPQAAPAASRDVGIYYDQDPDTRYQDALTAAQIRQAKVNQRAYVSPPVAKRPTPMGQLQMASVKPRKQNDSSGDVEARHGGIMHSSLGDYAAGGNPRLLKGPGDGMSDNIPATINGRQPARLADGEFVIPADVVSHLGNGSTEAGAKQLHAMMNNIRKARTGNPKQGKQINAKKYMPR